MAALAACGDKVTPVDPNNNKVVHSVTVTPASVPSLAVGAKITLSASVDADQGVTDRTVAWSSSDATIASVNATTGEVTGVKNGTVTITAKSNANPQVAGSALVTVGGAGQGNASISIGQINTTVCDAIGGCTSVPATLTNVRNQLDVTLNVDAAGQAISGIDLIMNCGGADTVVATQPFTSANVAAVAAAEEAAAPVTMSFNTAAFTPATGVTAFRNGACTLKARARLASGTQIATSGTPLTLNNTDIIAPVTITTTPSTGQNATATDGNGLLWRAGAVNVTAVPVIYTAGRSVASVAITLVNGGGDNAIGRNGVVVASGGTVASQSGLTLTSGAASASFANSTTASTGVGGSTVDTLTVLVTSIDNSGNAGPTLAAAALNGFIRLDNRAPDVTTVAPVVNLNVQNAQSGWVGSNFVFSTTGASRAITLDASTTGDFGGVDVVKVNTQWSTTQNGTFATFASTKDLAETAQATAYWLRLQVCDALNNCNIFPSSGLGLVQFGVDLTAPTLAQTGGVKDGDIYNIATGAPASISFTTSDPPGAGGVSGSGNPAAGNSVLVRDQALKPNGIPGSGTACVIGTTSGSFPSQTCSGPVAQPNTVTLPAAAANDGEYTLTAQAVDLAGNTSPSVTIKYYVDLTAPTLPAQGAAMPNPITQGTAFTGFTATDNMDVKAGYGSLVYPAPVSQSFAETGTATPTGAAFDNVLTQQSTVGVSLATFYRSLTTAVGTIGAAPTSINVNVTDAANNLSGAPLVTALPAANIGAPTTALNAGANAITAFAIDSTKPSPATADPGKPFVFHMNATPASDVTGNPFQQVCLFYKVTTNNQFGSGAAAGDLVKIGCTSLVATVGVGPTRRFWFPITWTPPAAFVNSTFQVYAIGHTSTLDGIISAPVTVTVNPVP